MQFCTQSACTWGRVARACMCRIQCELFYVIFLSTFGIANYQARWANVWVRNITQRQPSPSSLKQVEGCVVGTIILVCRGQTSSLAAVPMLQFHPPCLMQRGLPRFRWLIYSILISKLTLKALQQQQQQQHKFASLFTNPENHPIPHVR